MISALTDKDPSVRDNACQVLGDIGERAATSKVIIALIDALSERSLFASLRVLTTLSRMDEMAAKNEVIAALRNALRDKNRNVR